MHEETHKCDKQGGSVGGDGRNGPLCFTCHPRKSRLSFSGVTAGQYGNM